MAAKTKTPVTPATPFVEKEGKFSYTLPSAFFSGIKRGGTTLNAGRWRNHMADIIDKVHKKEKVYVRFTGKYDVKRKGSIGYIKEVTNLDYLLNGHTYYWAYSTPKVKRVGYTKANLLASNNFQSANHIQFKIMWEGRTNICNPSYEDFEILMDYDGTSVWKYEKPVTPKVIAKDSLDREINVGDFVVYVLHHFGGDMGASCCFGNVTKVTHEGEVWAKNIKLADNQVSDEKRIKHNKNITILTKDLMDQLMLAKLRSI